MNLDAYRRKRNFSQTPEPEAAGNTEGNEWRFVIQKHAARNLHYDLRLEFEGTLKSWAVPKGPSLDPQNKRLAIQTEDHPIEYLEFEGIIPEGQYGAGAMLVWDTGTWRPLQEDGFETGDLKFELRGEKLNGKWMLVHTGKRKKNNENRHWMLFKERDSEARSTREFDVVEELPASILTGRTLEQIKLDRKVKANSNSPQPVSDLTSLDLTSLSGAVLSNQPLKLSCCLPTATRKAPTGDDWIHEIKYDGYRMMCFVTTESVRFLSRNGNDWTDKLPHLEKSIEQLTIGNAILDGEIVVLSEDGRTNFQLLQTTISTTENYRLKYYLFDILYLHKHDLRSCSLLDRKKILRACIPENHNSILYSEHLEGDGPLIFQQACRLGTEGIVSKRASRRYVEGRTEEWVKTKCLKSAEFVVGGYTDSKAQRRGIGSLVVGRMNGSELVYQGRVGTGFNAAMLKSLYERLSETERKVSPFCNLTRHDVGRDYHWVEPQLVIEIEYGGWTNDGKLRFPAFRGIRDEIDPLDVVNDSSEMETIPSSSESEPSNSSQNLIPDSLPDVKFTNPDRLMYPDDGVSKIGLAAYIAQVSNRMLPLVVNRPLALVRCPKGYGQQCFFQKKPTKGMPRCIQEIEVDMAGANVQPAVVIQDLEGLLSLIQFSTLEIHVWNCRVDRPDRPDVIIFDLDPDSSLPFHRVVDAAMQIQEQLESVGLESFVKTSGGKGLHILAPIRRRATWEQVSEFSEAISSKMAGSSPRSYTTSPSKAQRKGKIYIDTLRNRFGATSIATYSSRARTGAPVSMPVSWDELPTLTSAAMFTTQNAAARLVGINRDPWANYTSVEQSLTKAMIRRVK